MINKKSKYDPIQIALTQQKLNRHCFILEENL